MRQYRTLAGATLFLCTFLSSQPTGSAQTISVGPSFRIEFSSSADAISSAPPQQISVNPVGAERVEFRLVEVQTPQGKPNFVVVSPSAGIAPAVIGVGLNTAVVPYLAVGGYTARLHFAATGQSGPPYAFVDVVLRLTSPPSPKITAVVNSASLQPGLSPGQMVSIFGENIGSPAQTAQFGADGLYPTELGNSVVTFNGVAAPLLYVNNSQINALVPYGAAGQTSVNVVVKHHSQESPPFFAAATDTAPAIFTAGQNGTGQGAILNSQVSWQSTYNSADNPVPKGHAITFFATGAGLWRQPFPDGSLFLWQWRPNIAPSAPVSVTIGGQPATVLYASGAPYQPVGMIQVNAIVPQGIGSGAQPIVLKIGERDNAAQKVTVAVE